VPAHFLKAKQGYMARKNEKDKQMYILTSAGTKFRNKKKFRYGIPHIPAHFEHWKRVYEVPVVQSVLYRT
jgi:hypothetical protein